MIKIGGAIRTAHNVFASTIKGLDVDFLPRNQYGEAQKPQAGPARSWQGVIQPASARVVALLPEGARSDGALLMHTSAQIFFADTASNPLDENRKQTFVRKGDSLWKVWSAEDWSPHTDGINRYILTRYVNVNGFNPTN